MDTRAYDCLLLDLDGTLVHGRDELDPDHRERLLALRAEGVKIVICTGRSEAAVGFVARELNLTEPLVVYNGAAVWDPSSGRLIEERLLSDRTVARTFDASEELGLFPIVQSRGAKWAPEPTSEVLRRGIRGFGELSIATGELPRENLIRMTLFSERHTDSDVLAREVETTIRQPIYSTHFPLNCLAMHRDSPLQVLDIQPPCRGKAEALRVVEEHFGIPSHRVVAIGDASNDVPMLQAAGLGVAVHDSMPVAREAADRVLDEPGPQAIGALLGELFPGVL